MTSRLSSDTAARLLIALGEIFGDRISAAKPIRDQHAEDEGYHAAAAPDYVAFPASAAEVSSAVALCEAACCPVVAWGAGTSLEANALAAEGGLCLDLSQMNAVLAINAEDLTATVQAGVRREQLNAKLKGTGLNFPVDPGANATLGGMAATRASGTTALRYGTMRSNVLACTVVMASGQIIRTAQRAPKSSAGYDLTALMVGSEGTLGIITDLTVRLHPLPEATATLVCPFETLQGAIQSVIVAIQLGLGMARIELLDDRMMAALNRYEGAAHDVRPTLFVEFHGSEAAVAAQAAQFEDLARSFDGEVAQRANLTEDRARLWKSRHNALYATRALRPGAQVLITDVCVPISRLADCLLETRLDLDASALDLTIAGHVGDGNFHAFIVLDPASSDEIAQAEALHERMARRAIDMDGTCTGEHGIGLGKRGLLQAELGPSIAIMATIKHALDPKAILNPGKIFVPDP